MTEPKTEHDRSADLIRIQGLASRIEANLPAMYAGLRSPMEVLKSHAYDSGGQGSGDPTGAAVAEVYGPGPARALEEIDRAIDCALGWLDAALNEQLRHAPQSPRRDRVAGPGDLWCVSCWHDDKYCEPISPNYAGRRLCRWCGDFAGTYGQRPPPVLLVHRHADHRITQQMVDDALTEQNRRGA